MKGFTRTMVAIIGMITIVGAFAQAKVYAAVRNSSIDVPIPFTANGGDTVTLSSNNENNSIITNGEAKTKTSDEFLITYDEPGTYSYTMSDGTSSYSVDINIYSDDVGELSYVVTAYDMDNNKVTILDFYDEIDISPTPTITPTPVPTVTDEPSDQPTNKPTAAPGSTTNAPTPSATPTPAGDLDNSGTGTASTGEKISMFTIAAMICLAVAGTLFRYYKKIEKEKETTNGN